MKTLHKFLDKNRIFVHIALAVYWITLILLTSLPQDYIPRVGTSDKTAHFLAYFLLAMLLHLALKYQTFSQPLRKGRYWYTLIIAGVFGCINEFSQKFIPGRFYELYDLAANFIGILLGMVVIWFIFDLRRNTITEKIN